MWLCARNPAVHLPCLLFSIFYQQQQALTKRSLYFQVDIQKQITSECNILSWNIVLILKVDLFKGWSPLEPLTHQLFRIDKLVWIIWCFRQRTDDKCQKSEFFRYLKKASTVWIQRVSETEVTTVLFDDLSVLEQFGAAPFEVTVFVHEIFTLLKATKSPESALVVAPFSIPSRASHLLRSRCNVFAQFAPVGHGFGKDASTKVSFL